MRHSRRGATGAFCVVRVMVWPMAGSAAVVVDLASRDWTQYSVNQRNHELQKELQFVAADGMEQSHWKGSSASSRRAATKSQARVQAAMNIPLPECCWGSSVKAGEAEESGTRGLVKGRGVKVGNWAWKVSTTVVVSPRVRVQTA